ncbi:MAG: hypothetical protein WCL51_05215 [Bacteroidota bacterium]
MRKYHIKRTMKSKRHNDVVQTMTDTGTKQEEQILIVPNAKYKKPAIFALRDLIIGEATALSGGDHAAKKRIDKYLDEAFNQFYINTGYYEEVANELNLPDLFADLGCEYAKPHTPGKKLAIEVLNTNFSGVVSVILSKFFGAKYYKIQSMISGSSTPVEVKTMHKTKSEISGYTPGLKYAFRAIAFDSDDNIINITDYFELRIA